MSGKTPKTTPAPPLPACPWCGGTVVAEVGLIVEPGLNGYGKEIRVKRLGRFSACTGCEFAVEGTWTGVEETALATV